MRQPPTRGAARPGHPRAPVPGGGFVLIYADITARKRAKEAIRGARDAAESALRELQTAQASLVHAQKMAALGQLIAGIAHEIKNPLNFVNNFAALSSELTDELSDVLKPVALPGRVREEVKELTGTLKDNLGRVVQHGKQRSTFFDVSAWDRLGPFYPANWLDS